MSWWYKEGECTHEERYDCFEDLAFEIASIKKNRLYEHNVNNIYIFNDDGLYLILKASEIDPLTIHSHLWNEEQEEYSQEYEFSRIEEDRMLYLTRVIYEKERKSEEELEEIKEKIKVIDEYSSAFLKNQMFVKEYKCQYDIGRNVVLNFYNLKLVRETTFRSHKVIARFMRKEYDLQYEMEENAYVLAFDSAMKIVGILHLSRGNDSECEIDVRIIFRFLLLVGAMQFVVVHNHPNGTDRLSQNDYDVSRQLMIASNIFNIKFLEHIIICNDNDVYCLKVVEDMLANDIEEVYEYYI